MSLMGQTKVIEKGRTKRGNGVVLELRMGAKGTGKLIKSIACSIQRSEIEKARQAMSDFASSRRLIINWE